MTSNPLSRLRRSLGHARRMWQNRALLDELLRSGNLPFLRFAAPGHFYSPLPHSALIARHSADALAECCGDELPGIDLNDALQVQLAAELGAHQAAIPFPDTRTPGHRYHFDNPYFSYGDAVVLFGILRRFQPGRIVEIGSGYSSAAMLDTNDRFFDRHVSFTFVEPFPDVLFSLLDSEDRARHAIHTCPVQDVPLETFTTLAADDVLFIDSSHVVKLGSDVRHLFFEVLPRLREGVIVHFHDILWPFEYPAIWLHQGRAWNEAYLLRAFLQFNDAFEILYFNDYMAQRHREIVERHLPTALRQPTRAETIGNSSLWLRRIRGPDT